MSATTPTSRAFHLGRRATHTLVATPSAYTLRLIRHHAKRLILGSVGLSLAALMLTGPALHAREAQAHVDRLNDAVTRITATNVELDRRVQQLRDPYYLEIEARKLGMVHDGEIAYIVPAGPDAPDQAPRRRPPAVSSFQPAGN